MVLAWMTMALSIIISSLTTARLPFIAAICAHLAEKFPEIHENFKKKNSRESAVIHRGEHRVVVLLHLQKQFHHVRIVILISKYNFLINF